ncbi:MAG: oxidoreductase [Chlorobi bacterium CHB2]|nr:oxidoreductase [Chlorobi bacterium CHB2]
MTKRTALLAGASGLVGGHCLQQLLADDRYERVIVLVRRQLSASAFHPKLVQRVINFDLIPRLPDFPAADDVFCTLGTTIHKARTRDQFYKVDFTYVHELAKRSAECGAAQFLLVSSVGASARSRVFYSKVKGEIEQALRSLRFEGLQVFRPSFLVGERTEERFAERMGTMLFRVLSPLMAGRFRRYRPVAAQTVARAMIQIAHQELHGVNVFESDKIALIGAERQRGSRK